MASLLAQTMHDLYTSRYNQVAPLTLLLYNYLLTFPDEVSLFWNRRWSIGQILFVLIRYGSIGWNLFNLEAYLNTHDSKQVGEAIGHHVYAAQGLSVLSMLHAILILRLYGLFGSKKLAYGLSLLLFATIVAEVYIVIKFAPNFGEAGLGRTLGNTCVVPSYSHGLTLIWPLILSFEVVAFLLALYKGVEEWRNGILRRSHLLQIIVRDSLAYFFIVFALDAVNFVLWLHARPTVSNVTFTFTTTILPILGTQMLMNIRKEGNITGIPFDSTGGTQTSDGATLEFRQATVTTDIASESTRPTTAAI